MAKLQKSQSNNGIEAEVYTPDSNSPTNIFNQQNNINLFQHIDLGKLNNLASKNPDIANAVVEIYTKQQDHSISVDNRILALEEKEQKLRENEAPYIRKFAFYSLYFAIFISLISLCVATYFVILGAFVPAVTAITIPFTIAVANLIGRNKGKDNSQKQKKK